MNKLATLTGVTLAALLLAIACDGDDSSPTPSPAPSPAVVLPSPTPEPTPTATVTPEPAVQRIAYRGTDGSLWIMNADGSGQERLTDIPAFRPRWSPDGSRIAFATCEPPIPPDFGPCTDRIYVMNAGGSNLTLLAEDIPASGPHWSPDGLRIAFASSCPPGGTYVINADGSGLIRLDIAASDVDWSADGRRLAYLQFVEAGGIDCGTYRGVVAHLDDNRIERIVPDEEPTVFGKGPPIFSPTNPSLLAYGDGLINLGTGQMQALPGTALSWSPNGQHLLLGLETCEGAQVYDVESASSVLEFDISLRAFDAPCWYHLPRRSAWSPDSLFLATVHSGEPSLLHIRDLATGDDRTIPIPENVSLGALLQLSPDGRHLLFTTTKDPVHGLVDIWVVGSDGVNLTLMAEGSEPAWQPQP